MIRSDYLKLLIYGLGIVVIQAILIRHLRIFGAESDLVLLFLLWLCTKRSRLECLIFAALLGLFQDAMTDLWGLNMFSKTLMVFIVHQFLNRTSENRFLIWQIFLIILGASFLHNLLYYFVSTFSGLYAGDFVVGSIVFVSTIFTAILGSFLHLVRTDN